MAITPVADRTVEGWQPSSADTDETVLAAPSTGRLALAGLIATIAGGLTSQTAVIKADTTVITRLDVTPGASREILPPIMLPLSGDLVVNATSTDVEITAWGADTT